MSLNSQRAPAVEKAAEGAAPRDPESALADLAQGAEGPVPDPRVLNLTGRAHLASAVIRALCAEIDVASAGIEDGMLDVSSQFRHLADRVKAQSSYLENLAAQVDPQDVKDPGEALPDYVALCLAGMNANVSIVSEQSTLMCSIWRDALAKLTETENPHKEHLIAVGEQIDFLSQSVADLATLIRRTLSPLTEQSAAMPEEPPLPEKKTTVTVPLEGLSRHFKEIQSRMETRQEHLSEVVSRSLEMSGHVATSVPRVTKAIQFQDTAKQRMDNVRAGLDEVAADLARAVQEMGLPDASIAALETACRDGVERVVATITLGDMRGRLAAHLLGETPTEDAPSKDDIELF